MVLVAYRRREAVEIGVSVVVRIVLVVVGGYAVASGLVALIAAGLPLAAGIARNEAVVLASMLGFLFYLALLICGFSMQRLPRLFLLFAALGAGSLGLAALIGPYGH